MQYAASILFFMSIFIWFLFARRMRKFNNLERMLPQLSEGDRARIIQMELGKAAPSGKSAKEWLAHQKALRFYAQIAISAVLLAAALYIILSTSFSPSEKHWAYGTVGTIIGFWLKGT